MLNEDIQTESHSEKQDTITSYLNGLLIEETNIDSRADLAITPSEIVEKLNNTETIKETIKALIESKRAITNRAQSILNKLKPILEDVAAIKSLASIENEVSLEQCRELNKHPHYNKPLSQIHNIQNSQQRNQLINALINGSAWESTVTNNNPNK